MITLVAVVDEEETLHSVEAATTATAPGEASVALEEVSVALAALAALATIRMAALVGATTRTAALAIPIPSVARDATQIHTEALATPIPLEVAAEVTTATDLAMIAMAALDDRGGTITLTAMAYVCINPCVFAFEIAFIYALCSLNS